MSKSSQPINLNSPRKKKAKNQTAPTVTGNDQEVVVLPEETKRPYVKWEKTQEFDILMAWLDTDDNGSVLKCAEQRNADDVKGSRGSTKMDICKKIVALFVAQGITGRTPEQVKDKIAALEKKYKKAVDFLNATGAGLSREDKLKVDNVMGKVGELCPDFERLDRIFFGRANITPPMAADNEDGAEDAARVLLGDGPTTLSPESSRPPTPFSEIDMSNVRVEPEVVEVPEDPPVGPPKIIPSVPESASTLLAKPKPDSTERNLKKSGKNPVRLEKPEPPKKTLPDILSNMDESRRIHEERKFQYMEKKLEQKKPKKKQPRVPGETAGNRGKESGQPASYYRKKAGKFVSGLKKYHCCLNSLTMPRR